MEYRTTNGDDLIHNNEWGIRDGLTKREYFAAMRNEPIYGSDNTLPLNWAMAVMNNTVPPSDAVENIKWWIEAHEKFAVMRADELIKALNETP